MNVASLKIAKDRGIKGHSKLKKNELVNLFKPVPAPRIKNEPLNRPVPAHVLLIDKYRAELQESNLIDDEINDRHNKLVVRDVIIKRDKALKNYTKSFRIEIVRNKDVVYQLITTRSSLNNLLKSELEIMKGLKFSETLKITFKKDIGDKTAYKTAFFNCNKDNNQQQQYI